MATPKREGLLKRGMSFASTMLTAFQDDKKSSSEVGPEAVADVKEMVKSTFPGALTSKQLKDAVEDLLVNNGYDENKTLLATSLCCDEVNRELEDDLRELYGYHFSMGGLAGFPFGGLTSFGAMAHHIPDDGSCVVLFGPHVGIDVDLNVGKINRRGRAGSGACCGSATAAGNYVKMVQAGERAPLDNPDDLLDAQQTWVGASLLPYSDRIINAKDENVELPLALYACQENLMMRIFEKGAGYVAGDGMTALLGGVQINTPEGCPEFFLPFKFEIRDTKGALIVDLLSELKTHYKAVAE